VCVSVVLCMSVCIGVCVARGGVFLAVVVCFSGVARGLFFFWRGKRAGRVISFLLAASFFGDGALFVCAVCPSPILGVFEVWCAPPLPLTFCTVRLVCVFQGMGRRGAACYKALSLHIPPL
jgi:hypothetical protein